MALARGGRLGALHGLSPANGWALAAARGIRAGDRAEARRALRPMACGQVAAMAVIACALSLGFPLDRALLRDLAGSLLVGSAAWVWLRDDGRPPLVGTRSPPRRPRSLVVPDRLGARGRADARPRRSDPCAPAGPSTRAFSLSDPLTIAVAMVVVHTAAMLLAGGLLATAACRGLALEPLALSDTARRLARQAVLAATGVGLMARR